MEHTFSQIITFDASADAARADLEKAMSNIEKTAYGQYLLEKLKYLYPNEIIIRTIPDAQASGKKSGLNQMCQMGIL